MFSNEAMDLTKYKKIKDITKDKNGTVILVEEINSKNKYTLATLNQKCDSEQEQKIFSAKISRVSRISKHPSVLRIFNFCLHDYNCQPYPTLLTEYMPNGTLADFFEKECPLDLLQSFTNTKKLINLFGIAAGMRHYHFNYICHGSLDPRHVIIDSNFYPHVYTDCISTHITDQISYAKKVEYESNDVYSFSLIAYQLITGQKPNITNQINPDISIIKSRYIKSLLQKCWSNDIYERPKFTIIVDGILAHKDEFISEFGEIDTIEFFNYHNLLRAYLAEYSNQFKQLADKENLVAMVVYGRILYNGYGVEADKAAAARFFRRAAERGSVVAMASYANMLQHGHGIAPDMAEAARYYAMAAKRGSPTAAEELAMMCEREMEDGAQPKRAPSRPHGEEAGQREARGEAESGACVQSEAESGACVQSEAESGACAQSEAVGGGDQALSGACVQSEAESGACVQSEAVGGGDEALGVDCARSEAERPPGGDSSHLGDAECAELVRREADGGDVAAMYRYAVMLEQGVGVEEDEGEAARYYRMAAEKGHPGSIYGYGTLLFQGVPGAVQEDKAGAAQFFKRAADLGVTDAMFNYAVMLEQGIGVEKDSASAARYYKLASDEGHLDAMYNYAVMLEQGSASEPQSQATLEPPSSSSLASAARYYKLAADRGHVLSMFNYGHALLTGVGVPSDPAGAARYFKMGADSGHGGSLFNLAVLLADGRGVPRDAPLAARYFELAAASGDSDAMNNLGIMMKSGDGVQADSAGSARYFKMAADSGNAPAMYNYARELLDGHSNGEESESEEGRVEEAARYMRMAADEGHAEAMRAYAVMLKNGEGVERDMREACRYFAMAAENGDEEAAGECERLSKLLDFTS